MSKLRYILYIMVLAVLTGCTDRFDVITGYDVGINVGDEIGFIAQVPQIATRATAEENAYWEHISKFERVNEDYVFNVKMFEEGGASMIASATYNPTKNTVNNVTTYDDYGTLKEKDKYLWWPSTAKKYAFHAVSTNSTETIVTETTNGQNYSDQSSAEKFFVQDRIEGYGYVPGWDQELNEGNGAPIRDLDNYNYMTAKEWYAANKAWGAPEKLSNAQLVEYWKKIPLFMRHKRSRITVLLRAGEGVERDQIAFDPELTPQNIHTEIYSYDKDNKQTTVTPLLGSYECEYEATNLLPKEKVTTACYDAIVEPHDYTDGDNMTEQKLLAINLSGMKFSFYAANDKDYSSAPDASNEDVKTRYNLTEGKHLILEVVLSTDTRKILITAYVVDWEDYPFSSICDDFGQAADPIAINDKADLIEFLTDATKNKAGNVGVIIPENFNLNEEVTGEMINKKHQINDASGNKPGDPMYTVTYESGYSPKTDNEIVYNAGWGDYSNYELKATLKLAGATITTNQCLFSSITASGSVVNGTIQITDKLATESEFECAIAKQNRGTIERVTVLQGETTRKATRAGLVTTNYGTIYACASQMPVYNPGGSGETLIGGIAAVTEYPVKADGSGAIDESATPVIRQCIVNARIDGGNDVKGGGIVGSAVGKVTDNTYEYGITLSQKPEDFKNIIYAKGNQSQNLEATGNEWPTSSEYTAVNHGGTLYNSRPDLERFDQVIDSKEELYKLLTDGAHNKISSRHRIAGNFTVDDSWTLGVQNSSANALLCELDGNDKTITLTGTTYAKMLFSNIEGQLHDLVLELDKPIEALPNASADNDADKLPARAPLAYAVVGENAVISNVKVKATNGAYVKATAASGLVVWAYGGATIEDCQSNVDVRIAQPEGTGTQQVYFVGGLVNTAAKANILRCTYMCDNLNNTEEANAVSGKNIYYGGIVGGTNSNGFETPKLNISDCTSWLTWENSDEKPHAAWGGIIGYSKYQNSFNDLVNATDGCQGNWWAAPTGASGQGMAAGMNEEKVIGKKNSVQPIMDQNY